MGYQSDTNILILKNAFTQQSIALFLSFALLLVSFPVVPQQALAAESSTVSVAKETSTTDQLIVVYEDAPLDLDEVTVKTDSSEVVSLEEIGITNQTQLPTSTNDERAMTIVTVNENTDTDQIIEELQDLDAVKTVQPNYEYSIMTTMSDPYAISDAKADMNQYYLYTSTATEAWGHITSDNSVTVAVLDTGCDLTHEDLTVNVDKARAYDATKQTLLIESGVPNNGDSNGHGTQVSGIIAAQTNNAVGIAGVSPSTRILPIRVFDDSNVCTTASLISAYSYLDRLIEEDVLTDLKVINLSLGYYADSLNKADLMLQDTISTMRANHNVLTICAGGNGDAAGKPKTTNCYPSDFKECLSVTALDQHNANAPFSDYNSAKDISAPGVDILTTNIGNTYAKITGSSMAAPIVAGGAALLWSANPNLTTEQVFTALRATADPVTANHHPESGSAGAINILNSLGYINGESYTEALTDNMAADAVTGEFLPDADDNAVMGNSQTIDSEEADIANSWRYSDGLPSTPDTEGIVPLESQIQPLAGTYSWFKSGSTWYTATNVGASQFAISNASAFGIDVSKHQGYINWASVKKAGVQFAIIRCGYGQNLTSQDDEYWLQNVEGCIANGIPFGVYLYSYANSLQKAASEADHVLRRLQEAKLNSKDVAYPVYYDLEESSLASISNRGLLANMAKTFCNKISQAGFMPGVYANQTWWNNYLTDSCFENWEKWVAQYPLNGSTGTTYRGTYGMWQCMSKGNIPGISTNADIDFAYDIVNSDGNHMYRMYNPNSGEHFYTALKAERNMLVRAGWRYEGVAWLAPLSSNTPVYRLYNPNAGDHHYTTSAGERDVLVSKGWRSEGIGWYSDDAQGEVLYRLYNPNARSGAHHYTLSAGERDMLRAVGWRYEGTCWHGKSR